MKHTCQEKKEEKKRVFEYMHSVADLSVKNIGIIWKTGIFIAILFVAFFVASYFVDDNVLAWLTFLMPLGAYLISRKYRVRKTTADMQFHQIWQAMWGIAAAITFVFLFSKYLALYGLFVVYYITITLGVFILYDLMRVQYAGMVLCGATGIALMGFKLALDPECTMRWCLGTFILFDVVLFILGGAAMQWQVKNHVMNPINFPQSEG